VDYPERTERHGTQAASQGRSAGTCGHGRGDTSTSVNQPRHFARSGPISSPCWPCHDSRICRRCAEKPHHL